MSKMVEGKVYHAGVFQRTVTVPDPWEKIDAANKAAAKATENKVTETPLVTPAVVNVDVANNETTKEKKAPAKQATQADGPLEPPIMNFGTDDNKMQHTEPVGVKLSAPDKEAPLDTPRMDFSGQGEAADTSKETLALPVSTE